MLALGKIEPTALPTKSEFHELLCSMQQTPNSYPSALKGLQKETHNYCLSFVAAFTWGMLNREIDRASLNDKFPIKWGRIRHACLGPKPVSNMTREPFNPDPLYPKTRRPYNP